VVYRRIAAVRRLARALVGRKEISGRRCRGLLFRAMRKDLPRSRAVAEKDRRHQQAWGAELRQALGRVGSTREAQERHNNGTPSPVNPVTRCLALRCAIRES
jgi:hypothetical protein